MLVYWPWICSCSLLAVESPSLFLNFNKNFLLTKKKKRLYEILENKMLKEIGFLLVTFCFLLYLVLRNQFWPFEDHLWLY